MRGLALLLLGSSLLLFCSSPPEKKPPSEPLVPLSNIADKVVSKIPRDMPFMILVSVVESKDAGMKRLESAVLNDLVHLLAERRGQEQSFMVTTPELRKRAMAVHAEGTSDIFDRSTGVEIGKFVRADATLIARLRPVEGRVKVTAKLVSMETGGVLASGSALLPRPSLAKDEALDPGIAYTSYRRAQQALSLFSVPPNTAGLSIRLDPKQVFEGRTYNIECSTKQPGYLYLFVLQTDGTMAVIFPNRIPVERLDGGFLDNKLPANGRFSTRGDFELTASVTGRETVAAVLTERPLDTSRWEKLYPREDLP
ncbi:MAG: DUF4384 domain-containing protein, partial [Planctomycetota bacterium]